MISNYFGINILTFPFGFIISIIFFFGIAQTNKIVLKKFQKKEEKDPDRRRRRDKQCNSSRGPPAPTP